MTESARTTLPSPLSQASIMVTIPLHGKRAGGGPAHEPDVTGGSENQRPTKTRTARLKRIHLAGAFTAAVSPDGKTVYVGGDQLGTGVAQAVLMPTATNTPSSPINLLERGSTPEAVAITADGQTAYFALITAPGGFVVPMNATTHALGTPITVGRDPTMIAIARHGSTMYVVDSNNQS